MSLQAIFTVKQAKNKVIFPNTKNTDCILWHQQLIATVFAYLKKVHLKNKIDSALTFMSIKFLVQSLI